jgi:copper transport protein
MGRHDCRVTAARRPPLSIRRRRLGALVAALVAGLLGAAVPASPASAHAALVSTTPVADSVVETPPNQVVLSFTEAVNPVAGKIKVIAPDGSRADRDEARASGQQLIIPLTSVATRGTYTVVYRVISADSHPVAGAFSYSVGERSLGGPPTDAGQSVQAPGFVLAGLPIARFIGYLGLLLLVGSVLVLALLWPQRLSREGPIRVVWIGAALVALGTVLELALQVPYVAGGGLGDIRSTDVQEVLSSQFGAAHLIRLGVLAAALVLLRPIVRGKGWGADRVLLAVLGTIAVATWSVSGHPSASPVPMVTVVADMIHIASMAIWLGGLAMLALFLLPRANGPELGAIVPVWSRWATYAVGALVLTGTAQALVEVGTPEALFTTAYGWMIVAKVALVGVVLLVAALSHRMVGSVTDQAEGSAGRLRRVVILEAAVAAVIIGVTSVLVQVTPARTSSLDTSAVASVQSATLRDKLFTLTVDVTPGTVGTNTIHLYATTPDGQPATIKEWKIRASLASAGIENLEAVVLPLTGDHATGQIGLAAAGTWTFTFELRTTEIDNGIVTTDFTIKD